MRRVSQLIALLLFTGALACGGGHDSTPPTASVIYGNWTLRTVNGAALPFIFAQTGEELTGGVLILSGASATAGSYAFELKGWITVNGNATTIFPANDFGKYSLNGTALTLATDTAGRSINGSWNGNSLTLADLGVTLVFGRPPCASDTVCVLLASRRPALNVRK